MKPALRYYGGKQKMITHILPLIPEHRVYVEPFAGGATVLFAKEKCQIEIINDLLDGVVIFYRVMKNKKKQKELFQMIHETPYSRSENRRAHKLYKSGTEIEKAWATWMSISTGFSGKMDGAFSVTTVANSSRVVTFQNYKKNIEACAKRLETVVIENIDALECTRRYDGEETFIYLDPPYLNADQGHYSGYSESDFEALLQLTTELKGSFLLSCYPCDLTEKYLEENHDMNYAYFKQRISAANRSKKPDAKREKTEMLIWNYDAPVENQLEIFE
jgi:DNA adenine methylase